MGTWKVHTTPLTLNPKLHPFCAYKWCSYMSLLNGLMSKVAKLGLIVVTYSHVIAKFSALIMCIKGDIIVHMKLHSNLLLASGLFLRIS
jgi:hypothetical protein